MSVFSIMKRRQAKEDKIMSAKLAGKQKQDAAPPSKYRHVPTHAAADALLGAPAGWMRGDAERIRESNQKRIALALSLSQADMASVPQSGMLSPLHINIHASGNSSSASSIRNYSNYTYSSSRRNSQYRKTMPATSSSSSSSANMHMSPSFNSLDAELYRARVPVAAEAPEAYVLSSSSSSSSSPSSSPSTPSLSTASSISSKDAGSESALPLPNDNNSFEMHTLPSKSENTHGTPLALPLSLPLPRPVYARN